MKKPLRLLTQRLDKGGRLLMPVKGPKSLTQWASPVSFVCSDTGGTPASFKS